MYSVYCDGSCLGNPGPGGVGIVIIKDNKVLHKLSFGEKHTTNNKMELLATISAIHFINETYGLENTIKIFTDSNYVVKGMTEWRHSWKKTNWKGCKKNQDMWKVLDVVGNKCIYQWVKAHNGDMYNEMANDLAQAAAREMQ